MTRSAAEQCNRADTPKASGQVANPTSAGNPASQAGSRAYSRRIVVVAKGKLLGWVDTTHCVWCTDEAVCSACAAEADAMRARA